MFKTHWNLITGKLGRSRATGDGMRIHVPYNVEIHKRWCGAGVVQVDEWRHFNRVCVCHIQLNKIGIQSIILILLSFLVAYSFSVCFLAGTGSLCIYYLLSQTVPLTHKCGWSSEHECGFNVRAWANFTIIGFYNAFALMFQNLLDLCVAFLHHW